MITARDWRDSPALRVSVLALAIGVVAIGWTLARALRSPVVPEAAPIVVADLGAIGAIRPAPAADVQRAVENNLFSPDRDPPAVPYRMPGEVASDNAPKADPMKPVVLGTAVANDGRSFATVQLGTATPQLVHVGDKIGEWTVKAIARGAVTLVTPTGSHAELGVSKPG